MPTITELVREHALITDTVELHELILRHHPDVTPQQVAAELRRQTAADAAEADALERYRRRVANDH